MERRLHIVIPDDTTVGELLNRGTIREVLPTHKRPTGREIPVSGSDSFKRHFGGLTLIDLLTSRQKKLPSTGTCQTQRKSPLLHLKRELTILQSGIDDLRQQRLGCSPCPRIRYRMISLPKAEQGTDKAVRRSVKKRNLLDSS